MILSFVKIQSKDTYFFGLITNIIPTTASLCHTSAYVIYANWIVTTIIGVTTYIRTGLRKYDKQGNSRVSEKICGFHEFYFLDSYDKKCAGMLFGR